MPSSVEEKSRKKRKSRDGEANGDGQSPKKMKLEPKLEPTESGAAAVQPPSGVDIKEILEQGKRMIEQRKKEIFGPPKKIDPEKAAQFLQDTMTEKNERAENLKQSISERLKNLASLPNYQSADRQPGQPTPLILDSAGRTVDTAGKEIQLVHREPTLKANIRAEKRAQFQKAEKETTKAVEEKTEEAATFFDSRVMAKGAMRPKRGLKFHEKGQFEKMAKEQRAKAKLEKLQQEIDEKAKKTGISTVVKLALVAPKLAELADVGVPKVEWWDDVIMNKGDYDESLPDFEKSDAITSLVEHPIQMRPPGETGEQKFLKVYLTKKERKKLRRQNRREAQREQQEKIRLGLEPPPDPKVKISNLMRVLGSQAIMDPTKMEAHVREQMAKRLKKHEEANLARKLTPQQKREKKIKKLKEAAGLVPGASGQPVHVAVYRITDLSNPAKKFKVEMLAKQLYLTGTIVIHKDINVVVVEGAMKPQKCYKNLVLRRIKWEEETAKEAAARAAAAAAGTSSEKPKNSCVLVWEGEVKKRSFGEMKIKMCPLEKLAREHFQKHNVEHYWDLAYSGAVLQADQAE